MRSDSTTKGIGLCAMKTCHGPNTNRPRLGYQSVRSPNLVHDGIQNVGRVQAVRRIRIVALHRIVKRRASVARRIGQRRVRAMVEQLAHNLRTQNKETGATIPINSGTREVNRYGNETQQVKSVDTAETSLTIRSRIPICQCAAPHSAAACARHLSDQCRGRQSTAG